MADISESSFSVPFEPLHAEVTDGNDVGRRALLGGMAAVFAVEAVRRYPGLDLLLARCANQRFEDSSLGAIDQSANAAIYSYEGWNNPVPTSIDIYNDKWHPAPKHAPATNFIFMGLGEINGNNVAADVACATRYRLPTRYQQIGNQPITIESMTDMFISSFEDAPLDTPTYGVTLHSMADIMFFLMLKRCREIGYTPPRKLSFVTMLSSPSGIHTADFGEQGVFFTNSGIGQDALGKYVVSFFRAWEERGFNPLSLPADWLQANQQFSKGFGAAPPVLTSQMRILEQIGSRSDLVDLLCSVSSYFSPDTKVNYIGPRPGMRWTDTVVDEKAAYGDIACAFKQARDIKVRYVNGASGHANYQFATRQEKAALLTACTPNPRILPNNFNV